MQRRGASSRETVASELDRLRDAKEDNVIVVGSVRGEDTTLHTIRFDSEQELLKALELLGSFAKSSTQSTRTAKPAVHNSGDMGFGNNSGLPMSLHKDPQVTNLSTNSSSFLHSSSSSSSVSKCTTSSVSLPSYLRAGYRSESEDSDDSYSLPFNQSNQFSPKKSLAATPSNMAFRRTTKVELVRQEGHPRKIAPHRWSRIASVPDSSVDIVPMEMTTDNRPRISIALTERPPSVIERRGVIDLSYSISSSSESLGSSISYSEGNTDSGWSEASESTIWCHREISFLIPPFQSPRRSISVCSKKLSMSRDKFGMPKKAKVCHIRAVSDFC